VTEADEEAESRKKSPERSLDMGSALIREAEKRVAHERREAEAKARREAAEAKARATPPAKPAKRKRSLRVRLAAASLSFLAALVVIELGARCLPEPPQIRGKRVGEMAFHESLLFPNPAVAPGPPYMLDHKLGFCLLPDFNVPQEFPEAPGGFFSLHTNHQGLRDDREALVPKPPGMKRILCVGDSMTFGLGVERKQAYPGVLEQELGSLMNVPLEVVNAGVSCWGQQEEVAFLEHRAPALEPDLVILQFTVANDVLDNLRYREVAGELVPDPELGADLALHPIFTWPLTNASQAWRLFSWQVGRHIIRYRAMEEKWRLDKTSDLIKRARDAATAMHAKFALLIAPTVVQLDDYSTAELLLKTTEKINAVIEKRAEADGIPVMHPLLALKKSKRLGQPPYFPKDMHWNPVGHEVVARELAPWLEPMLRGN
jgi:lysophospholipase L1-like esterase